MSPQLQDIPLVPDHTHLESTRKKRAREPRDSPVCDACRLRRVKCIRESAELPCKNCSKKHVQCTISPRKSYKARSGARIAQAKELYGETCPPSTESLNADANYIALVRPPSSSSAETLENSIDPSLLPTQLFDPQRISLAYDSPQTRLSRKEDYDETVATLFDNFWRQSHRSIVHIYWRILREKLDMAGRRPYQMDNIIHQALTRAIMTLAALVTDSPVLIGNDAPSFSDLSLMKSQDLSRFGNRRAEYVDMLFNQVVALADAHGIFRQTSPEALGLILLLMDLSSYVSDDFAAGTAWLNSGIAAVKERAYQQIKDQQDGTIHNTVLIDMSSWAFTTHDCFLSAWRGTPLRIADSELIYFIGPPHQQYMKRPSLELVDERARSTDPGAFFLPIVYFWTTFTKLVRKFAQEVSLVVAQSFDLPDGPFHELMNEYESLYDWIQSINSRLAQNRVSDAIVSLQREQVHLDPQQSMTDGLFITQRLPVFFHHQLVKFEEQRLTGSGLSYPEHDRTLDERLAKIKCRVNKILWRCAIDYADSLSLYEPQELLRYGSVVPGRANWLTLITQALFDAPLEEDGGMPDFDLHAKIQKCETMIDALKMQAWSFPQRQETAAKFEEDLRRLRGGLMGDQFEFMQ